MKGFWSRLFTKTPTTDFAALVREGAIIVDVRTVNEYREGHIQGSLNIPLDDIRRRLPELGKQGRVVITCCRSGARSGMATSILKSAGITSQNGGAWDDLARKLTKQ